MVAGRLQLPSLPWEFASSFPRFAPMPNTPSSSRSDTRTATAARGGQHLSVQCRRCRHRSVVCPGVYGEAGRRPLNQLSEILRRRECGTMGDMQVWLAGRR